MNEIEEARGHYRLYGDINALFIALFADARELDVKELRQQKPDYLARFRADGFVLIDVSDAPSHRAPARHW